MTATVSIILITLLTVKHFIVDFLLQPPFMYLNKGIYGHIGGISHSVLHAMATMFIIGGLVTFATLPISPITCLIIGVVEFIIHYHVDYAKVNITHHYGWTASTSEYFWMLMGADQLLHSLTYIAIVAFLI